MPACLLRILMSHVEIHMVIAMQLHLTVDGTRHNIARSERQAWIVLLHELLAAKIAEHTSITPHRFCDQERRAVAGMIKSRRVELYEFHVGYRTLGTVDHGYAVAGSHQGIGCGSVNGSCTAGSHHRDARQECVHLTCSLIEDIGSVASDIGSAARHYASQMMLRDNLYGKMMLEHIDIGRAAHLADKALLDLIAGIVGMVQDAEFRVSSLTVEVEVTVSLAVEVHAPVKKLPDLVGRTLDYFPHRLRIAQPVAGYHRIMYMFVEIVDRGVGDRGNTTLRKSCVSLIEHSLAYKGYAPLSRHFQGKTHACNAGTYHQIIVFAYHCLVCLEKYGG